MSGNENQNPLGYNGRNRGQPTRNSSDSNSSNDAAMMRIASGMSLPMDMPSDTSTARTQQPLRVSFADGTVPQRAMNIPTSLVVLDEDGTFLEGEALDTSPTGSLSQPRSSVGQNGLVRNSFGSGSGEDTTTTPRTLDDPSRMGSLALLVPSEGKESFEMTRNGRIDDPESGRLSRPSAVDEHMLNILAHKRRNMAMDDTDGSGSPADTQTLSSGTSMDSVEKAKRTFFANWLGTGSTHGAIRAKRDVLDDELTITEMLHLSKSLVVPSGTDGEAVDASLQKTITELQLRNTFAGRTKLRFRHYIRCRFPLFVWVLMFLLILFFVFFLISLQAIRTEANEAGVAAVEIQSFFFTADVILAIQLALGTRALAVNHLAQTFVGGYTPEEPQTQEEYDETFQDGLLRLELTHIARTYLQYGSDLYDFEIVELLDGCTSGQNGDFVTYSADFFDESETIELLYFGYTEFEAFTGAGFNPVYEDDGETRARDDNNRLAYETVLSITEETPDGVSVISSYSIPEDCMFYSPNAANCSLIEEGNGQGDANFTLTQRPWYIDAVATQTSVLNANVVSVWSNIYDFADTDSPDGTNVPGITVAKPVYQQNGELRGVGGADLALSNLNNILHSAGAIADLSGSADDESCVVGGTALQNSADVRGIAYIVVATDCANDIRGNTTTDENGNTTERPCYAGNVLGVSAPLTDQKEYYNSWTTDAPQAIEFNPSLCSESHVQACGLIQESAEFLLGCSAEEFANNSTRGECLNWSDLDVQLARPLKGDDTFLVSYSSFTAPDGVGLNWGLVLVQNKVEFDDEVNDQYREIATAMVTAAVLSILLTSAATFALTRGLGKVSQQLARISNMNFKEPKGRRSRPSAILEFERINDALFDLRFYLRTLQMYVPRDIIWALVALNRQAVVASQQHEMTVMFVSLKNAAEITKALDPLEFNVFLNLYLQEVSMIIADGRKPGTVDKYMGTTVMAFWNAPLPNRRHALAACQVALAIDAMVKRKQKEWLLQCPGLLDFLPISVNIGIATGPVLIGNFGATSRFNYTALGDTVNLASRITGINKRWGTSILCSYSTYSQSEPAMIFRRLDKVAVKGKAECVQLFELVDRDVEEYDAERWAEMYSRAVEYMFDQREFTRALKMLKECQRMRPNDPIVQRHIKLAEKLILEDPGPQWTGVVKMNAK
eukprot:Clim_evm36s203 gene=Clim_evmTU36s203